MWIKIKEFILKYVWNKYIITLVVFAVFITFFDEFNLQRRFKNAVKIRQLNKELKYYSEEIEQNKEKIERLHSNDDNLEKFAREQYLMKKPNEDIFIIEDE